MAIVQAPPLRSIVPVLLMRTSEPRCAPHSSLPQLPPPPPRLPPRRRRRLLLWSPARRLCFAIWLVTACWICLSSRRFERPSWALRERMQTPSQWPRRVEDRMGLHQHRIAESSCAQEPFAHRQGKSRAQAVTIMQRDSPLRPVLPLHRSRSSLVRTLQPPRHLTLHTQSAWINLRISSCIRSITSLTQLLPLLPRRLPTPVVTFLRCRCSFSRDPSVGALRMTLERRQPIQVQVLPLCPSSLGCLHSSRPSLPELPSLRSARPLRLSSPRSLFRSVRSESSCDIACGLRHRKSRGSSSRRPVSMARSAPRLACTRAVRRRSRAGALLSPRTLPRRSSLRRCSLHRLPSSPRRSPQLHPRRQRRRLPLRGAPTSRSHCALRRHCQRHPLLRQPRFPALFRRCACYSSRHSFGERSNESKQTPIAHAEVQPRAPTERVLSQQIDR